MKPENCRPCSCLSLEALQFSAFIRVFSLLRLRLSPTSSSPAPLTTTCRSRRSNRPGHELRASSLWTPGGEHHVLTALMHVGHRQPRLRTCRHRRFPDALAGLLIVGMKYRLSTRAFAGEEEIPRHQ